MNRGWSRLMLLGVSLISVAPLWAAVEQTPVPCRRGYCLWERPVLTAPKGWALDRAWSERLQQSVYVEQSSEYAGSSASMMARAAERAPGQSLKAFLQAEQDRLVGTSLSVAAAALPPLPDAAGKRWPALRLAPRPGLPGHVQTAVFIEEPQHFIVIVLNTNDDRLHRQSWPAFAALVRSYRPQVKRL